MLETPWADVCRNTLKGGHLANQHKYFYVRQHQMSISNWEVIYECCTLLLHDWTCHFLKTEEWRVRQPALQEERHTLRKEWKERRIRLDNAEGLNAVRCERGA